MLRPALIGLGLGACLAFLSGCGTGMQGGFITTPPVLQIPLGQAALVYADSKATYAVLALRLGDLCKAGKLSASDCSYLDKQAAVVQQLDADVRAGILGAQGQIDWDKVMKILEVVAGLAMKVAGTGGGGAILGSVGADKLMKAIPAPNR